VGIPALVALFALAACSTDEASTTSAEAETAAPSLAPLTDGSDVAVDAPPADTADLPLAPITSSDLPLVITVTVGTDSCPDRIEQVALGSTVTISITDPADPQEYHVHGYDLGDGQQFEPGQAASFTFTADRAGDFEIESHDTGQVLIVLRVT
jgi:hypothetical protein